MAKLGVGDHCRFCQSTYEEASDNRNGLVSVFKMLQSERLLYIHKGCHEKVNPVYTLTFCITKPVDKTVKGPLSRFSLVIAMSTTRMKLQNHGVMGEGIITHTPFQNLEGVTLYHSCLQVHGGVPIELRIFWDPLVQRINCLVIRN